MTKKALAITSYNHNTIFSPLIFKFGKNSAAVLLNVMRYTIVYNLNTFYHNFVYLKKTKLWTFKQKKLN